MFSPYRLVAVGTTLVLHDQCIEEYKRREDKNTILERYFHDMYVMFLDKLTRFAVESCTPVDQKERLKYLLNELIKTRTLLEEAEKNVLE